MRATLVCIVILFATACGNSTVTGGGGGGNGNGSGDPGNPNPGEGGGGVDGGTLPDGTTQLECAGKLDGDCGTCMEGACCERVAACAADDGCWSCIAGGGAGCEVGSPSHDLAVLYWACELESCKDECRPDDPTPTCADTFDGLCGECLAESCCDTVDACAANPWCVACANGDDDACGQDEDGYNLAIAVWSCGHDSCEPQCYGGIDPDPDPDPNLEPACILPDPTPIMGACAVVGPGTIYECNPVTGAGCNTFQGATCDKNPALGKYVCYQGPNVGTLCEGCGSSTGQFCQPGLTCLAAQCVRYCCSDFDCGPFNRCDHSKKLSPSDVVGLCVQK